MNQHKAPQTNPAPASGLSFAFPMRLPDNGTGAGGPVKPTNKSWARAKSATRQNLPRR